VYNVDKNSTGGEKFMVLGILGFLGFIVCLVAVIGAAIKKSPNLKKWGIALTVCFVAFIIGVSTSSDNTKSVANNNTVEASTQEEKPTKTPEPTPSPEPTLSPEEVAKKAHDDWVEAQFSLWDGSHIELVKLVKENMNDPKSFEHAETKYLVLSTQEQIDTLGRGNIGDLYIYMKFRGANAFGGTILSEVEAVADYKNNTITILNDF
jgi:hypothetical protein